MCANGIIQKMLSLLAKSSAVPRFIARLSAPAHRVVIPINRTQFRCISTNVIPCDVVNSTEANFRYDISAPTIFQFDDSPSSQHYAVQPQDSTTLDVTWLNAADCTNNDLIERLIYVSNYCTADAAAIESEQFDAFVDTFTAAVGDFIENEFMAALQVFSRLPMVVPVRYNVRNYTELWMCFDDHCGHWSQKWSNEKLLIACDIWSTSPLRRKSKFCSVASRKLLKRSKYLPAKQYLQAIEFVVACDKALDDKTPFIKDLERILDEISVGEVGTVCGILKQSHTSRLSKMELIDRIVAKTLREDNFEAIDDKALKNLLGVICDSIRLVHKEDIHRLMEKLCIVIPHCSVGTAQAICELGERIHVYHEGCLRAFTHKAKTNLSDFTLKSLEQLCFLYIRSTIQPDFTEAHDVCRMILEDIPKRITEISIAPKRLVPLLYCLAILGHHNVEIIDNALRKEFIDTTWAYYKNYPPELFGLDTFVKVNLRDTYTGNRLENKHARALINTVMGYIPDRNGPYKIRGSDLMLIDMADIVGETYKYYYMGHALPSTAYADIYMIYDKSKGTFIDYSEHFPEPYSGVIMWKDELVQCNPNLEVIVLLSSYWKNYCDNTTVPATQHMHKIKQMELLGYKPVDICYNNWIKLDAEQRRKQLSDRISSVLATLQ